MSSYQNVPVGNSLGNIKKENKITLVDIIIVAFFAVYAMYPSNQAVLYVGFGLLFVSVFFRVVFHSDSGTIQIPSLCTRLTLFSVYSLSSILWAINPSLVYDYAVVTILSTLLTVVLVSYILQCGKDDIIFYTLAIIGIALAIFVIISYGGFSGFYNSATEENARLGGDVNNENVIGMQCAYSAIVIFGYALFFKKRLCYALFLIPSLVVAACGSRKAMLAVIIGVILLIYFKQQEDKTITKYLKYIIIAVLVTAILIYVLQLPIMATFAKRFGQMLNFYEGGDDVDNSTKIRSEMISVAFKQFMFKPFLGIGLRNSEILNSIKLNHAAYSHNDYMELLVNGGIVGFLLYYSIYFHLIKCYMKIMKKDSDPKTRIAFVMLINFLIANWGNVTYYGSISTYLYLTLWIGHVELKKRQGVI